MKKLLIASALALPVVAGAVITSVSAPSASTDYTTRNVCDGTTATKVNVYGGGGTVVATPVFIRTGFVAQCSANTIVRFKESSTLLVVVAAGSVKGNQSYNGSTNGGAIVASAKCTTATTDACNTTDIDNALTAAITAAGST